MMKLPTIRLHGYQWGLLGGAAACVVVLAAVRFFYLPVLGAIGDRRAALRALQVKLTDAQAMATQLSTQTQSLDTMQARYRIVEQRVGAGQSVARILEELSQRATTHRIELMAIQPKSKEGDEVARVRVSRSGMILRKVPLKLQLTGSYRQIGTFLGTLREAPFLSSIETLAMTEVPEERALLRADVTLTAYLAERE